MSPQMLRLPVLSALALVTLTGAALAYDLGNGMVGTGEVKLEYLDYGSGNLVGSVDYTLTWRSSGMLGFDASLDALQASAIGGDMTNIWAALVLSTGAGEFGIGAPRPVTEVLDPMPDLTSSRYIDLLYTEASGPLVSIFSMMDNGMTPGLAFIGESAALSYGLSVHRLDGEGDEHLNTVEAAMRASTGTTTFFITGEWVDMPSNDITLLQIGALRQGDRLSLGAALSHGDSAERSVSTGRVYASYAVLPALSVTGDYLAVAGGSDLYSASAEYSFGQSGFVEGGATVIGNDEIYDIGVGLKF